MAISGLVLTLRAEHAPHEVLAALEGNSAITIGPRHGLRLAVVAETNSPAADRDLFEQLRALPQIANVDVTYVYLDEPAPPSTDVCVTGVTSSSLPVVEYPHVNH